MDITPWLTEEGVDWGDSAIEAYLAQGAVGDSPVDYRLPNRQITAPMRLTARGTVTFETIRRQVQAKVALFQREGGWISRVTAAGGTVFADIVNASLTLGGDWMQAQTTAGQRADVNAVLTLEAIPDFYGAEVTLDDKTETSALALTTVLKQSAVDAVIAGDYPGRVRMVVDEDQGQTQLGLVWGYRSRYYDSASTAALTYEAEALTPLDVAGTFADATASGGTVIRHNSVPIDWTPVLSTRMLAGTADLTHRGSYRTWVRAKSAIACDLRFVWDVGDFVNLTPNSRKTLPVTTNFQMVDLGEIRLDPVPVGTHRWQGVIQAQATSLGSTGLELDSIMFQPIDDGAGRLSAVMNADPGTSAYSARDSFAQTAGTLTGKTLDVGGTWGGAGDTDDFSLNTTNATADRTAVSDATMVTGRLVTAGTGTYSTVAVQVSLKTTACATLLRQGVLARYVDANNWVALQVWWGASSVVRVTKTKAGNPTDLASGGQITITQSQQVPNYWMAIRVAIDAAGRVFGWFAPIGAGSSAAAAPRDLGAPILMGQDADLATGGVLATGKVGLYDVSTSATAATRSYDNFSAWVPTFDATIYANRSAQLTTSGIFRQDTTGTAYGPALHVGDLPRLPPSGLENRKVELYIKTSRGDFDQIPDTGIDDISAQAFYRPSWLFLS